MDQKKDPGVVKLVKHMPPEILSKFQRLLVTFKIQIPNDRIQPIREAEDMEEFLLIGSRSRGNWNSNPQPTSRKLHGRSCGTYLTCVSSRFVEESLQGCCAPGSACGRYCECSPDMIAIIPVSTPSLVDPFQVPFILDLLLLNVYFFYDLFFTNGKSVYCEFEILISVIVSWFVSQHGLYNLWRNETKSAFLSFSFWILTGSFCQFHFIYER